MEYDKQVTDEVTSLVNQKTKDLANSRHWNATKKGDNAKFLRNALASYNLPTIDIGDAEQVANRIDWYFNHCLDNDCKPGIAGLCNALGITRMTFFNWQSKVTRDRKEHHELAVRAKGILEELYEQYMMNGKINPVTGIFLMKNNFEGYYDRQDVVLTPGNPLEPQKNEAELKRLYSANDVEDE
jgi:hypothetical protein